MNSAFITSYERDTETDLDFAQARMYANRLGRFTTTDPIYITEERLIDPQAINLFVYVRNNPLVLSDPTGLDFEFTGKDKDKFINDLNTRDGAQFQTKLDNNGIVQVVDKDKVDIKKLNKAELALFNAINDPNNRAVIEGVAQSAAFEFGGIKGKGVNQLDASDMEQLRGFDKKNKTGQSIAGQIVAHEMMEAYTTATMNTNGMTPVQMWEAAHPVASGLFGEPEIDFRFLPRENPDTSTTFTGGYLDYTFSGNGKSKKFTAEVKFSRTWTDVELANRSSGSVPPGDITRILETPKKK